MYSAFKIRMHQNQNFKTKLSFGACITQQKIHFSAPNLVVKKALLTKLLFPKKGIKIP